MAQLFGRLLVADLDIATLQALREPALEQALMELGITLPEDAQLENVAADYFALILQPTSGLALVQSLFEEGQYEGEAAASMRAIARDSGYEPTASADRSPSDHAGNILALWGACVIEDDEVARFIEERHLPWLRTALVDASGTQGFYGDVARAVLALLDAIEASRGGG